MLAPVAAEIDLNLQRLRDIPAGKVLVQLELELDRPAVCSERDERAELVVRQAVRNVELHGWDAAISPDGFRLVLSGGSVTLDLGLSAGITSYITDGANYGTQGVAV
jgi:hypothetical protein